MDLFSQDFSQNTTVKKSKDFNTNTDNNDTWLTPPELITSLGVFDLDPCSPINRPWDTAKRHYTIEDNGLIQDWEDRVWLNPPYGRVLGYWLEKMANHGNGIALTFARTETQAMQKFVFPYAESILFINGRIKFYKIDGTEAEASNAPSILIGYDEFNSEMIEQSGIKGHHISLRPKVFITGISYDQNKTWRIIVGEALEELKREATLSDIYETVLKLAPNKIRNNNNYKAKIRQTLQLHYDKITKATYGLN